MKIPTPNRPTERHKTVGASCSISARGRLTRYFGIGGTAQSHGNRRALTDVRPHHDYRAQHHQESAAPKPEDKWSKKNLESCLPSAVIEAGQDHVKVCKRRRSDCHFGGGLLLALVEKLGRRHLPDFASIARHDQVRRRALQMRRIERHNPEVPELVGTHRKALPLSHRLLYFGPKER